MSHVEQLQPLLGDTRLTDRLFSVALGGKRFLVATDGTGVLGVECDKHADSGDHIEAALGPIFRDADWKPRMWGPIAEYLRGVAVTEDCGNCRGTGEAYCEHCENYGKCYECSGKKKVPGRCLPVEFFGSPMNKRLLARFLVGREAQAVLVATPETPDGGPVVIRDKEGRWFVAAMPLRAGSYDTREVFP